MTIRKHPAAKLTTTELYNLDVACRMISAGFDTPPYLVGTAGAFAEGDGYRDVDVRLILGDEDFAIVCPTRERWELLSMAITAYLCDRTGLPVDFQIQRRTEANEKHDKPRNPLGLTVRGRPTRHFAGGGDATPQWDAQTRIVAGPSTDGRLFSCPDCTDRTPHERGSDECAAWAGPGTDGGDQA